MRVDTRRSTGILSVIFIFLLILSACGEDDKTQSDNEAPEISESSEPEEASASEPADEPEEDSASEPADDSTTVGTLLDPDEWFYLPTAGSVVAVVGVEHWDILEIHEDPGVSSPLVGTLDPLDDTVVA